MIEQGASQDRIGALHETLIAYFGVEGIGLEGGTIDAEGRETLARILDNVSPEDVAEVLQHFDEDEVIEIFRSLLTVEAQGRVLEETDQKTRREVLIGLSEGERLSVIGELPPDDLVDLLPELPAHEPERIVASLPEEKAEQVEELLRYDPETAGGLMTTEFIAIPLGTSSRDALARIQGNIGAEIITYVYVTDTDQTLYGVVSIREILRAAPSRVVDEYMETDVISVRVDEDREDVAAIVERYNLHALPVVDAAGRIRGIVTFDDVIEAVQEENSEDIMRMAGTTAVHPLFEPFRVDVAKRLPFLLVTMIGGLSVAIVLDSFQGAIIPALVFSCMAPWIHLVSALSGNVAVVTSTVMVRGLATGDLAESRIREAVVRELLIAVLIALILALAVGVAFSVYVEHFAGDWPSGTAEPQRALYALGCAMLASLAWAGLVGGLVPVICQLSRVIDPAIASGPFVTITCDISASAIFLFFIHRFLVA